MGRHANRGDLVIDSVDVLVARQEPGALAASKFLRRVFHSTVVAGDYLYIDGGQFSYWNNGSTVYKYSDATLSIDLSQDFDNATVSYNIINKPNDCPNLNLGALWYHEAEDIIYSGIVGSSSLTYIDDQNADVPDLSLWALKPDHAGQGTWSRVTEADTTLNAFTRPGQSLTAFGKNIALAFNGSPGNRSVEENNYQGGLLKFDMATREFTNSTTNRPALFPTRKSGSFDYVPNFGPEGIFVAMGGRTPFDYFIDFESVLIYDPATDNWFNQSTTGTPPKPRVEFCTTGIASTNGSYEIFLYGGSGGALGEAALQYDTISILTLPAFRWISVPYNAATPKFCMTCDAVGGSQILVLGGANANGAVVYGSFESILYEAMSTSDKNDQALGIFDLQSLSWASKYTAKPAPYQQSSPIQRFYANDNKSYKSSLVAGVDILMAQASFATLAVPGTNVTQPPAAAPIKKINAHAKNHTAAIAGGVVGGLTGLALILVLFMVILRRKAKTGRHPEYKYEEAEQEIGQETASSPQKGFYYVQGADGEGKWISEVSPDPRRPSELSTPWSQIPQPTSSPRPSELGSPIPLKHEGVSELA